MKKRTISVACLALMAIGLLAQQGSVPAYHAGPPPTGAKLPPILAKEQLWTPGFQYVYQRHAYELAPKISAVIYQQPCYCHCDRMGHTSLRSCYESTHAAECGTCLQELYYSYRMSQAGKTPKQIRQGMIRGEWKRVELETAADMQ